MRTFIAIELDEEIKKALTKIQSEFKNIDLDIKWVKPQNIHLTIKFLGEVKESKIPEINQALKETCNYIKPFVIETENLGVFPNIKFPRVIWAGLKEENEELKKLVNLLEEKLVKLKFSKEKRGFSAHLTLGRFRSQKNKEDFIEKLNQIKVANLRQEVKSVKLFKSTLTPQGPIYEELNEENFKKL